MKKAADAEQWREAPEETVNRFVRRFDESYRLLAYHAALPLVLTPELVNYLRNEFLRDKQVPWVAEVDLLLSDLCSQVGYELYAMDTHLRAYLLEQMEQDSRFGKQRMQQVAQVLISYVTYLKSLNPRRREQEIEAQQWAAMVYLGDEECKKAVRQIAERLLETSSGSGSERLTDSGIRAELARLTRITEELSPQLKNQPNLLNYARLVQKILRTPEEVEPAQLHASYQVEDVELRFPDRLLPESLARNISSFRKKVTKIEGFPPIQTLKFKIATTSVEEETQRSADINLQPFEFEVALIEVNQSALSSTDNLLNIVEREVLEKSQRNLKDFEILVLRGVLNNQTYEQIAESAGYSGNYVKNVGIELWKVLSEVLGQKVSKINFKKAIEQFVVGRNLTIHRHQQQNQYFIEDLGNGILLEMVQIPAGTFTMGAPETEEGSSGSERPQHQVTVSSFSIGKYAVTQAQWKAVAALPRVNRELEANPSNFKGDNLPVERVCWYDAVEFCARLSNYTSREYSIPSEAEWEYACRALTTTPFHFGETITTDLANYRGTDNEEYKLSGSYGRGPKGIYREETTPVGSFDVANAFGLYDMHGNVWEWCLDDWHDNYEGVPTDGSAWFDENNNFSQKTGSAVLRGGSWFSRPRECRCAYRLIDDRAERGDFFNNICFRVICRFRKNLR